jgi:hypothetical protein
MPDTDAYSTGYAIGTMAFLLTLGLIFWYVGRWGWLGVLIRNSLCRLSAAPDLALAGKPAELLTAQRQTSRGLRRYRRKRSQVINATHMLPPPRPCGPDLFCRRPALKPLSPIALPPSRKGGGRPGSGPVLPGGGGGS